MVSMGSVLLPSWPQQRAVARHPRFGGETSERAGAGDRLDFKNMRPEQITEDMIAEWLLLDESRPHPITISTDLGITPQNHSPLDWDNTVRESAYPPPSVKQPAVEKTEPAAVSKSPKKLRRWLKLLYPVALASAFIGGLGVAQMRSSQSATIATSQVAQAPGNSVASVSITPVKAEPTYSDLSLHIAPQKQKFMACATTSEAMALKMLNVDVTADQLDLEIGRAPASGTPVASVLTSAKAHGVQARAYNNSSIEEIEAHLKAKRPIMALIDAGDRKTGNSYHAILLTGFVNLSDGRKLVEITDPTPDSTTGHQVHYMLFDYFQNRYWNNLNHIEWEWGVGYHQNPTGFNNMMVVFAKPGDTLPDERFDGQAKKTDDQWVAISQQYWRNYVAEQQKAVVKKVSEALALMSHLKLNP